MAVWKQYNLWQDNKQRPVCVFTDCCNVCQTLKSSHIFAWTRAPDEYFLPYKYHTLLLMFLLLLGFQCLRRDKRRNTCMLRSPVEDKDTVKSVSDKVSITIIWTCQQGAVLLPVATLVFFHPRPDCDPVPRRRADHGNPVGFPAAGHTAASCPNSAEHGWGLTWNCTRKNNL